MGKFFNKEVFANRLSALMEEHGDTTYSLGGFLHLSPPTISRYCSAEMEPKNTTIEIMAIKYGVNPAWLMGTEGQPKYLDDVPPKKIPVVGVIAAGQPIIAFENVIGYEYIPSNIKVDFCLKVKGDSMTYAKINDGDIVYIRQQPDVENGEIAAVMIDGAEATLKRVYKYSGTVVLKPENSNYQEIVFDKKSQKSLVILGKCVYVKFSLE